MAYSIHVNFYFSFLFSKVFDKNGDGFITASELRQVMSKLGENLSDSDVEDMFSEADLNKDGKIDYQGTFVFLSFNKYLNILFGIP